MFDYLWKLQLHKLGGKSILETTMTDVLVHEARNCTVTIHLVVSYAKSTIVFAD